MSIVSNIHQFTALDKNSKALTGQRLVRLIAKGANKHENLSESLCVSVPRVEQSEVVDVIDRLIPHLLGLVQDTQDKIIREWRITEGRNEIPGEVFGVSEVVAWLDANASGDRVTQEYLQEWFAEEYAEAASQYIANAMGLDWTPDSVPEIVTQKCNVLRDMFAGWSSPKYSPNIPKLKAMIRFSESMSDLDSRMAAMQAKCVDMLAKKEKELSEDALGF